MERRRVQAAFISLAEAFCFWRMNGFAMKHGLGLPDFLTLGVDLRGRLLLVSEQAGQEMVHDVRNSLSATADFFGQSGQADVSLGLKQGADHAHPPCLPFPGSQLGGVFEGVNPTVSGLVQHLLDDGFLDLVEIFAVRPASLFRERGRLFYRLGSEDFNLSRLGCVFAGG